MIQTVYVGHRFNFKDLWPQVVSYLHNNGGYVEDLPLFKTDFVINEEYKLGLISRKKMDEYIHINEVYNTGSYNFIAIDYFKNVAQQYGLEIFIHFTHSDSNEDCCVLYIDIGAPLLGLGAPLLGLDLDLDLDLDLSSSKDQELDMKNYICNTDTALCNIDYIHRVPFNQFPFFSYCITASSGPRLFFI